MAGARNGEVVEATMEQRDIDRCSACGEPLSPGARSCPSCGATVATPAEPLGDLPPLPPVGATLPEDPAEEELTGAFEPPPAPTSGALWEGFGSADSSGSSEDADEARELARMFEEGSAGQKAGNVAAKNPAGFPVLKGAPG